MKIEEGNPAKGLIVGLAASFAFAFVTFWIFVACCCSGCAALPADPATRAAVVSNAVSKATLLLDAAWERWVREHPEDDPAAAAEQPAEQPGGDTAGTEPGRQDSERLVFRYGGFKGGGAVEDPATQIADVRISKDRLSYRWAKGGCENFGAKSREDSGAALACAFFWSETEQAWIGGKFDWISSSRTTRDWKNLNGGYGGWDAKAFWAAPRRAFCIVAANGRKRTNLEVTK